jgi:hypothetical protein
VIRRCSSARCSRTPSLRVPPDGVHDVGQVELLAVDDGLAGIHGIEAGELEQVAFDEIGESQQHLLALTRREPAPVALVKGATCRGDGSVDILLATGGDVSEHLPSGRHHRLERRS